MSEASFTAKLGKQHKVTVPKHVREFLKVGEGEYCHFVVSSRVLMGAVINGVPESNIMREEDLIRKNRKMNSVSIDADEHRVELKCAVCGKVEQFIDDSEIYDFMDEHLRHSMDGFD